MLSTIEGNVSYIAIVVHPYCHIVQTTNETPYRISDQEFH